MPTLSNDVSMSGPERSEPTPSGAANGQSVLSNLPRTRPQRRSPRRGAAGEGATSTAGRNGATGRTATATPGRAGKAKRQSPAAAHSRKRKTSASPASGGRATPRRAGERRAQEPVPRQGFEAESESAHGLIQPPGGAELVASAFEIVGELAKSGFSTGERMLKDALSRLPLS
jgi:hypothetical protein